MSEPVENLEPPDPTPIPTPLEAAVYPDSCAAWTVTVTPGSATAKVLALLDPVRLSQAGRVDALVGLERLQAWAAALQAKVMTALVEDPSTYAMAPRPDPDWIRQDVKACLGESSIGANTRIRTATELVRRLPDTLEALQTGRISARHAHAVVETTRVLDDGPARQVEQAALPVPGRPGDPAPTMASFRTKLRRARIKADPRTAAEQAARAAEDRDVWVMPQDDAMAFLGAPLPAEGAATVLAAVNAKADQIHTSDDARTKAQRRADGLVQLCSDYITHGSPDSCNIKNDTTGPDATDEAVWTRAGIRAPRYHGLKPQIQVSVALSTLLGRDDQPADLAGSGPIPADVARRIAADPTGTWRRLITDPAGRLVDYGRSTYRPPMDLAQYVIARDRTCRAPGCNQPAAKSDLHHVVPWSQGGETNAEDLASACQHDHYSVHEGGWQIRRLEDDTVEWTSPTGHTYRVPPATYPIDTTSQQPDPAEGEDRTGHATGTGGPVDPNRSEDQTDHGDQPATDDEPPF